MVWLVYGLLACGHAHGGAAQRAALEMRRLDVADGALTLTLTLTLILTRTLTRTRTLTLTLTLTRRTGWRDERSQW